MRLHDRRGLGVGLELVEPGTRCRLGRVRVRAQVGDPVAVGRSATEPATGLGVGPHGVGDPQPGPVALGPAHRAVVRQRHVVPVVVDVDGAAQLGHPEPDAVVGELEEDPLELRAREGALRLGDDQGVPAAVRVLQIAQDAGGFGAAVPRQASALVDVVVGGDDLAVGGDEPGGRVGLPAQAVGRVLQVVGRGAGAEGEADHAASRFWWSRRVRTMRARTPATLGVITGAQSATKSTGLRCSWADDARAATVPLSGFRGGGLLVPVSGAASTSVQRPVGGRAQSGRE